MSFDTMDQHRRSKKTKPKLESSVDLSADAATLAGMLPTPTLKQLKPLDYRPHVPQMSPSVPLFDAHRQPGCEGRV